MFCPAIFVSAKMFWCVYIYYMHICSESVEAGAIVCAFHFVVSGPAVGFLNMYVIKVLVFTHPDFDTATAKYMCIIYCVN